LLSEFYKEDENSRQANSRPTESLSSSFFASKISRRPFPKSAEPRKRRPLDLLHINRKCPRPKRGEIIFCSSRMMISGFRFGSAFPSRSGQVILDCLMNILPYIERQTGNTLKAIRSGNALEFCSGIFPAKLKQLGISQEFTLHYEHEQAGIAENTNRTIMDNVTCFCYE
jgi:hypothetical protein